MTERSELPTENSGLVAATTVARLLGVSPMTLWRRRRAGTIPDPVIVASRLYWRAGVVRMILAQVGCDISTVNRPPPPTRKPAKRTSKKPASKRTPGKKAAKSRKLTRRTQ